MKKTTAFALVAALSLGSGAVGAADDEIRPGLAVLLAENMAANPWWDEVGAGRAQALVIAQLEESRRYRVMPRRQLAETLAQEGLWLSGGLSPAGAVRLGRELDVSYLVSSTLVEFGTGARGSRKRSGRKLLGLGGPKDFKTQIVLRLIDTAAGRTVWSDSRRAVTPLGKILAEAEEGERAEEAVFERALRPLLEEMAAQLGGASIHREAEDQPAADRPTDEGAPRS